MRKDERRVAVAVLQVHVGARFDQCLRQRAQSGVASSTHLTPNDYTFACYESAVDQLDQVKKCTSASALKREHAAAEHVRFFFFLSHSAAIDE